MPEIVKVNAEVLSVPNRDVRERMMRIRNAMDRMPGTIPGGSEEYHKICPLKETFADGCYIRELFMPKGNLFSTRIHKVRHPYFMLKGDCSILTEEGIVRIKGPFSGITPAGTMRIIYTHEDTIWATVHVTNETDVKKIQSAITTDNFDDLDNVIDVESPEELESTIKRMVESKNEIT